MVEVSIATLDGPDGPLQVAATERGLVATDWAPTEAGLMVALRRRLGEVQTAGPMSPAGRRLAAMIPVLTTVLDGAAADTARLPVDLRDRPAFDQRVLAAVRELGWGETASYGEIARRVGSPRAARAVGSAIGRNPIALVIPCHRVIASDGTLGGYGGDGWQDRAEALGRKRALLAREGVNEPMRER